MSERPIVVLDASVGVKWFKEEAGSQKARTLYQRGANGEIVLAAPTHFVHEVLSAVGRYLTPATIPEGWEHLCACGLDVVPLTSEVIAEAAAQCEVLGCCFYDALAPACASLLGATLASADAKAHGSFRELLLVE